MELRQSIEDEKYDLELIEKSLMQNKERLIKTRSVKRSISFLEFYKPLKEELIKKLEEWTDEK